MRSKKQLLTTGKYNSRAMAIYKLLQSGSLSRTDIAEHLQVSTAAVTTIVGGLIKEGIISEGTLTDPQSPEAEAPDVDSSGTKAGRPKAPLLLNREWKLILCIDIHAYYINVAVTDLLGNVFIENSLEGLSHNDPEIFCSQISKECIKMLWQENISMDRILGAGITIIGPVNRQEGIALHPFRLFDNPVSIKDYFRQDFPFPVIVESNVCAFLAGELLYTDIVESSPNVLMLKWGPGVGSAMAIHGEVYKGYNYLSTEIGHNQISEKNGKKCNCGRTGCLEPYISTDAMAEFISQQATEDPSCELASLTKSLGEPSRHNLKSFLDTGNSSLWEFVEQCAHSLAAVTNNAIHLLAPNKILLVGELFSYEKISSLFTRNLYSLNPKLPDNMCMVSEIYSDYKYIGSCAIVMDHFLTNKK